MKKKRSHPKMPFSLSVSGELQQHLFFHTPTHTSDTRPVSTANPSSHTSYKYNTQPLIKTVSHHHLLCARGGLLSISHVRSRLFSAARRMRARGWCNRWRRAAGGVIICMRPLHMHGAVHYRAAILFFPGASGFFRARRYVTDARSR